MKLILQRFQAVFDLKNLVQREYYSRKLQEVIADSLGHVEASISKVATDTDDGRIRWSRKIHELQNCLL
jgi:hypothetical protein